jgi:hypothetical protein
VKERNGWCWLAEVLSTGPCARREQRARRWPSLRWRRGPALASWTPGIVLNAPGSAGGGYSYATAVNRYGHTLFALGVLRQGAPGHWQVQVRTRSGNGVLGPLHAMSMPIPANDPPEPAAAVSDSGSGVVAWVTAQRVMAGLVSAAGKPGRVLTLSQPVATAPSLLRVVMSPTGEAFVAWDGNQRLQARFISPAGKPHADLRWHLPGPRRELGRQAHGSLGAANRIYSHPRALRPMTVTPPRGSDVAGALGGTRILSVLTPGRQDSGKSRPDGRMV